MVRFFATLYIALWQCAFRSAVYTCNWCYAAAENARLWPGSSRVGQDGDASQLLLGRRHLPPALSAAVRLCCLGGLPAAACVWSHSTQQSSALSYNCTTSLCGFMRVFYSSYDCRFSLFFVCRLSAVAAGQAYRFHNAVSKEIVTAELSGRLGLAFLSLNHQNQSDEGLAAENVFKKFYEMFVICDE